MLSRTSAGMLAVVLLGLLLAAAAAPAAVTFTRVWPQKIRYLNGEDGVFQVALKNDGAEAWSGRVSGTIESDLDQSTPIFDEAVTLAAGEEKALEEHWKINLGEFGHAIHVFAKGTDGVAVAEGQDVFCVGPWYYNMGRCITFFNLRKLRTPEEAEKARVLPWRQWYITCAEHFAGPPGAWGTMVPQTEEYYTGQAAFPESVTSERALIDAAHRNGIAMMQYDVVSIWGPPAEDYSRAHPDWITYNDRGRPGGFFNMAEMDYFRSMTEADHKFMSPGALNGNVANRAAQEAALDDMIDGLRMFNFDGVRWDGHTFGQAMDVFGNPTLTGDVDEANAKWITYMKERLRAALPNVTVNYNYYPQSTPEGRKLPKTYQAMGPHAYILWESMRGRFNSPTDPLNVWTNFVEGVRQEINLYARPNGNFQHFGWYAANSKIHQNHTQAIYYALGGHWDTWTPLRYDAFSMRYGQYLWDTSLRNLDDPTGLVQVTDPDGRLWWKQFVQEKKLDGGRRLLITHLLNKPVHERQDGFEKDAPPVQKDIKVTLTPPAGEKVGRAFLLSPDADRPGWCALLQPAQQGGAWSVVVPSVEFWSFVVWEVGK
jgi:hypothetical protein